MIHTIHGTVVAFVVIANMIRWDLFCFLHDAVYRLYHNLGGVAFRSSIQIYLYANFCNNFFLSWFKLCMRILKAFTYFTAFLAIIFYYWNLIWDRNRMVNAMSVIICNYAIYRYISQFGGRTRDISEDFIITF